ncbi:MAG: RNA 2',3'-cyclic phosphodiesterase [Pseudomonadota bacterium]|nr:RNA 2',3'-cyclic phosphodiesterase [Pseudomonadota bacterium]
MIRLFAAVAIPASIGEVLARRQQGLPGARWRPAQSLHITLRFAGDIAENQADDLDAELAVVAGAPSEIVLSGVGAFGEGAKISAVWAGAEESDALRRLAAACETAARRAGLKAAGRAWRPHVTLAYLKRAEPARVAAWIAAHNLLKSPPFAVSAFGLYSTRRTSAGSIYRLERAYPLG